jgi:hypothetical protein
LRKSKGIIDMDLKAGYELVFNWCSNFNIVWVFWGFRIQFDMDGWGLDMGIQDFLGECQLGRRRELKKIDFERFKSSKNFGFVEIFEIPVIRGSKKENK